MISIICPYTNRDLLEKMLLKSLDKQDYREFELVLLDSKKESYTSASQALNSGVSIAKGDILVFAHQDIEFFENDALSKIKDYCDKFDFSLGCVAGVLENGEIVSSVIHGSNYEHVGRKMIKPEIVFTCDECLFFTKRDQFRAFTDLGKTWHFYAVEYALRCQKEGKAVMSFPIPIYHFSPGWSRDDSYWTTLYEVSKLYGDTFKTIPTTLASFRITRFMGLFIVYKRIKCHVKKLLQKR